jgi:RimJ/RimL family protein N-acetyltransferase
MRPDNLASIRVAGKCGDREFKRYQFNGKPVCCQPALSVHIRADVLARQSIERTNSEQTRKSR